MRLCNRLCCCLEMGPPDARTVLPPGEDAPCPGPEEMNLELLLPGDGGHRRSVASADDDLEAPPSRYLLLSSVLPESPSRRSQQGISKSSSCLFKNSGDERLVEVRVQKEEGVVTEPLGRP